MSKQENRNPKCETCGAKDDCPIRGTGSFEHSSMKMSELPPFLRMLLNSTYGASGDVSPSLSILEAVKNGDFPSFMRIMEENRRKGNDPRVEIIKAKISSAKELVVELEEELANITANKASDSKEKDENFIKGVPADNNKCTCDACQGKSCNTASSSEEPDEDDEDEKVEYIQRRIYDFFETLKNDYDPSVILSAINDLELEGYPPILKLFDFSEHMLNSINDTLADTDGSVDEINTGIHHLNRSNEAIVRYLSQILDHLQKPQKVEMSSMYGSSGNNPGPFSSQPEVMYGVSELRSFPESPELTPLFEKYLKMLIDKRAKNVFKDKKYKLLRQARKAAISAVNSALARRDEGIFEDQLPFFDDRDDFDSEIIDMITSRIEGYLAAGQDGNNTLRAIVAEELSRVSRENQLKEDKRIKMMIRDEIKKANQ